MIGLYKLSTQSKCGNKLPPEENRKSPQSRKYCLHTLSKLELQLLKTPALADSPDEQE